MEVCDATRRRNAGRVSSGQRWEEGFVAALSLLMDKCAGVMIIEWIGGGAEEI